MSYRERERDHSNSGLKKIGLILIGLLAFGVAKVAVRAGIDFAEQKTVTSASIERRAEADKTAGPMTAAMKMYFPSQYHEWTAHVAELIRNGASEDEVFAYGFGFSRDLIKSHSKNIARAPDSTLAAIAQKNSEIAFALSTESKKGCAEFGFEGLRPQTAQQLSEATVKTIGTSMPLALRAAYEGQSEPTNRPTELSEEAATEFVAAVQRQGLSTTEIDELFKGKAGGEDVLTKCRMTTALYRAVASLPERTAAHVTAILISQ